LFGSEPPPRGAIVNGTHSSEIEIVRGVDIIERAFQLAPECESILQLERRLSREGYTSVAAHLSGKQIRREITDRLNPELKSAFYARIRTNRERNSD
jgi:hypothetical protein